MLPERFRIRLTYGDVEADFELRMISVDEENQYVDRLVKLDRTNKEEEFRLLVDTVASWSTKPPVVRQVSTGELVNTNYENTESGVKEFFGEFSPSSERLVNQLLSTFRRALIPKADFL